MPFQPIERINEKIREREVRVRTEAELMAAPSDSPDIVIVTFACDLRGISCMIIVPVAGRGVFTRAQSVTLDGVSAFPGPAPNERLGVVDTQLFAEQPTALSVNVSGNEVLIKLLTNQEISARCVSVEGNVYERSFRLEELEYARLVAYNSELPIRKFQSRTSLDALLRGLSVGSKIFVNGGLGVVIGSGTRHSPESPSLSFSVDIFGMEPSYVDAGTKTGAPALTIGIPLPVASEETLEGVRAYARELKRTGYVHSPNETTLGERIKDSISAGDLRLTDSLYAVFAGPQADKARKD